MKICLIHDDFLQSGGAENLFATIASMWPDSPIYTSLVDWQKIPHSINRKRIKTSWMQKIPFARKYYKVLVPIYPFAFESFNFKKYDLVISSSTRFAKSIITSPKTIHISYVNATPRFLWDKNAEKYYFPKFVYPLVNLFLKHLKRWDEISASRPDYLVANSQNVRKGIKKYYNRESEVLYPFANTNYFKIAKIHNWSMKKNNYFLIVSRLVKWKQIETAIQAAKDMKINLVIVGDGPDKKRLVGIAENDPHIDFKGKVTIKDLTQLYSNCKALIVTQEEDFGIAAVEAQSCGIPIIAYKRGGVREIVIENKTGVFYSSQTPVSLKDAIKKLSKLKYTEKDIRENALRFSRHKFEKGIKEIVEKYVS